MKTIQDLSPMTGEVMGSYTPPSRDELHQMVERGRIAQEEWAALSVKARLEPLKQLRLAVMDRLDEVVERLSQATGKVTLEALTADVFTTVSMIDYYEKASQEILAPKKAKTNLALLGNSFHVERSPMGLLLILSPWNYPLQLAMVPLITAATAGNAVVLKPTEVTPSVGVLIQELLQDAGYPPHLLQVALGGPDVGKALIEERPDKIFFTGSVATGKKIMQAASENLIPLELELGGKDPMVVFEDANLERAVHGAVYGAFSNAGQICVSVERLYVQDTIYEKFVQRVTEETQKIRLGDGVEADIGPIIHPPQKKIIADHINDALQKGAKNTTPIVRRGNYWGPVLLRDADHGMKVMTEETFGPVLPIMPFRTEDQAVALANDSIYGLNASVWSRDLKKARRVARRIVSGNCAINNVIVNIANPSTPFGGEKMSGFGRYHGPEGLYTFSRTKTVMVNRGLLKKEINWFPYRRAGLTAVKALMNLLYGRFRPQGSLKKAAERLMKAFQKG